MSTARERIQQTLDQYETAMTRLDDLSSAEETPERLALAASTIARSAIETTLLAELCRLDPARADQITAWIEAVFVDDGEVGDEWMSRWREEMATGLDLTPPLTEVRS